MNVGIAGGGLLGRLIAWRALRGGHRVTLYESGSLSHSPAAARTAAGMIAPLSELVASERVIYDMGLASLRLWPQWVSELNGSANQSANGGIAYSANGSLAVAHPQDRAEIEQFHTDLCRQLGDGQGYRWLDRDGIAALEPDLAVAFDLGLWLEHEAHIDNRALLDALLAAIEAMGGSCRSGHAARIQDDRILADGKEEGYDWVVDCRGTGSDWPGLRGVRGEVLWIECPEVTLSRPVRLMHPRYKLYVVPKSRHRFVVGATEIESEDRSPVSVQSMLELTSALYTIHPAFAEARIIETDVNLRPAFADNLPRIESQPGLIRANGLYRHGYLLAPVVVDHVLGIIDRRTDQPFESPLAMPATRAEEVAAGA
jgi:glycine oxidase